MNKIFLIFIFLACSIFLHAQETYVESVNKIIEKDLGLNLSELQDFYIGIYAKGKWIDINYSFDDEIRFSKYDSIAIGSLSKLVTSMYIYEHIDSGYYQMESKITDILPLDNKKLDKITVESLLSHNSGLPLQVNRYLIDAHGINNNSFTYDNLIDYLNIIEYDPLMVNFYNHVNFAILSMIISEYEHVYRNRLPFYGSEGMEMCAADITSLIKDILYKDSNHPLFSFKDKLVNVPYTYATYGILAQRVKRNKPIFLMSGRTFTSRCIVVLSPESKNAVLIFAPFEEEKLVDLSILIMRMLTHNWKNL